MLLLGCEIAWKVRTICEYVDNGTVRHNSQKAEPESVCEGSLFPDIYSKYQSLRCRRKASDRLPNTRS